MRQHAACWRCGSSNHDLRFVVNVVGISSTNRTVYQGLDSIVVGDRATGGPWQCPIEQIRPVDVRRMRADLGPQGQTPPQR